MRRWIFAITLLLYASTIQAQNWSGILSSSRATDWTKAGLPAILPDGETTPNAWTPPTRTQCGSTISTGASAATINAALAACASGHYVLLGPGIFSISADITLGNQSGVTLRGSGADQTFLNFSGGAIHFDNVSQGSASATWTAGYTAGTTIISTSGAPSVGTIADFTRNRNVYQIQVAL